MATWVALFRGVNVGGNNILPMKSLSALMTKLGCEGVQTYIQSGNVVFRRDKECADLEQSLVAAIAKVHRFAPRVFFLSVDELKQAIEANPFRQSVANHKMLYLHFLAQPAKSPDLKQLNAVKAHDESFVLTDRVFYLHAPGGMGKSKLAARVERLLGVDVTARNWQTVTKVMEIAEAMDSSAP